MSTCERIMSVLHRFKDRQEAGTLLAQQLVAYAGRDDVLILALPRGGVPVGFAISQALNLPLDIMLVRKLGVPGHEEYAMGAIASAGVAILHRDVINSLGITMAAVEQVKRREAAELERRERLYRASRPAPSLQDRTVILVDDGLATGATMQAALEAARAGKPARLIVAVPVAPPETCRSLRSTADDIVCLKSPEFFQAVGQWYEHFEQTGDAEVIELLAQAERAQSRRTARPA